MTAYGTIESAVEAMRLGAFDYIQKPFTEQELLVKVAKALDNRRLAGEVDVPRERVQGPLQVREHHRPLACRARGARPHRAHRADRRHRAHHGRERDGQGARGEGHPRQQQARRAAVRPGQLRSHHRDAPRERALRARQGLVHGRGRARARGSSRRPTEGRSSSTRLPKRPSLSRPSSCAPSRRTKSGASARTSPSASTSGSSPRPTRICSRPSPRSASGRTSTTASTSPASSFRRSASGARTSPMLVRVLPRQVRAQDGRSRPSSTTASSRRSMHYDFPGNIRELEHMIEQAVGARSERRHHRRRRPARRPASPLLRPPSGGARARRRGRRRRAAAIEAALRESDGSRERAAEVLEHLADDALAEDDSARDHLRRAGLAPPRRAPAAARRARVVQPCESGVGARLKALRTDLGEGRDALRTSMNCWPSQRDVGEACAIC